MGPKLVAVLLLGLALTSCSSSTSGVRRELADARNEWSEAGISDYRLELAESRNFFSRGCRWSSSVRKGVVVDASIDPESSGSYCVEVDWTVEMLHDRIVGYSDEIDQMVERDVEGHTLEVTFGEYGVPTSIEFDLSNVEDDSSALTITLTPTS